MYKKGKSYRMQKSEHPHFSGISSQQEMIITT